MMRKIIIFLMCFGILSHAGFAQEGYPLSKETFKELDYIWSELVSFSQNLYNMGKEILLDEQKELISILLNDISDITFSLLTLITMLEIEFIHAGENQFNPEVIVYIIKYSKTFDEIVSMNIQRNNGIVDSSQDALVAQFYERTNQYLNRAKSVLAGAERELLKSTQGYSENSKDILLRRKQAQLDTDKRKDEVGKEEADATVKAGDLEERVIESDSGSDEGEILQEVSWSITRYNPKTGYIKYYTKDGRYVGKRKK